MLGIITAVDIISFRKNVVPRDRATRVFSQCAVKCKNVDDTVKSSLWLVLPPGFHIINLSAVAREISDFINSKLLTKITVKLQKYSPPKTTNITAAKIGYTSFIYMINALTDTSCERVTKEVLFDRLDDRWDSLTGPGTKKYKTSDGTFDAKSSCMSSKAINGIPGETR